MLSAEKTSEKAQISTSPWEGKELGKCSVMDRTTRQKSKKKQLN